MNRDEEVAAIDQYLAARGASRCPAAFLAAVRSALAPAEASRRIAQLTIEAAAVPQGKGNNWLFNNKGSRRRAEGVASDER